MKHPDGCIEDNMHDKEASIGSFLRNVFIPDPNDPFSFAGLPPAHETPRSLEELANALRPNETEPCPPWMKAY